MFLSRGIGLRLTSNTGHPSIVGEAMQVRKNPVLASGMGDAARSKGPVLLTY